MGSLFPGVRPAHGARSGAARADPRGQCPSVGGAIAPYAPGKGADAVRRYSPGRTAGWTAGAAGRRYRHGADAQPDRALPGHGVPASAAYVLGRAPAGTLLLAYDMGVQ